MQVTCCRVTWGGIKQPPLEEVVPIRFFYECYQLVSGRNYNSCCGKNHLQWMYPCSWWNGWRNEINVLSAELLLQPQTRRYKKCRENKRIEVGGDIYIKAIRNRACYYRDTLDYTKALEHWHQVGELGCASSCFDIGLCYMSGNGVGMDEKRAIHYYELSAMGGTCKG